MIVTYNIVCSSCGELLLDGGADSASKALKMAYSRGWRSNLVGGYVCDSCPNPGHPSGVTVELHGPPDGYEPPDVRCACGAINWGTRKVCKKCGEELRYGTD